MKINVHHRGLELTSAIKGHINKKVESLHRLIDLEDSKVFVHVVVGKTHGSHHSAQDQYFAEFEIRDAGEQYHITAHEADLYAAIDRARDDMLANLRRRKDKKLSGRRKERKLAARR